MQSIMKGLKSFKTHEIRGLNEMFSPFWSRKYICQTEKCKYVVFQNGKSHCRKRKIDRRKIEIFIVKVI